MATAGPYAVETSPRSIPATMQAAVYRGVNDVRLETVPVPQIGAGEMLVRVHSCGVCGTDLKKIATGSHSAPRIFGHETSGIVAAVGENVRQYSPGDRVVVFHHIRAVNVSIAGTRPSRSAPPTKKSDAPLALNPPAADSPNTSASWIGLSNTEPSASRTTFLSSRPASSNQSTPV